MTAVALTIAGSDSGGGAGIQADLAAFAAFGVFGACAITAVTAQNTLGVRAIHPVPPEILRAQIEAVLADFAIGAIKIGMVPAAGHAKIIAECLAGCKAPIVVDPVMVASAGQRLADLEAVQILRERLFPLSVCITPNLPEAAALLGMPEAASEAEMASQATALLAFGPQAVLLKGGHGHQEEAVDILARPGSIERFAAPRVESRNLHGTGCALSSAIAAGLASGLDLPRAVAAAKSWLAAMIRTSRAHRIGTGKGPVLIR